MDRMFSISPRHTDHAVQEGREVFLKRRNQLQGEAIRAVFRFPKSVADQCTTQDRSKTLKKYRSHRKVAEKTIELGAIGKEVEHNLRQTILNQTKNVLSPPKTSKSAYLPNRSGRSETRGTIGGEAGLWPMQYESNKKTLDLLQKAIVREDELFYFTEDILQLHTSKFPLLRKREHERESRKRFLAHKYSQFSFTAQAKQEKYPEGKDLAAHGRPQGKQQKPDIRGWDTAELQDGS